MSTLAELDGKKDDVRLYFDGGCLFHGKPNSVMQIGYHIISSRPIAGRNIHIYGSKIKRSGTSTASEYHALIAGLNFLNNSGYAGPVSVFGDNLSVIQQLNGKCNCNKQELKELRDEALKLLKEHKSYSISWIPKKENKTADLAGRNAQYYLVSKDPDYKKTVVGERISSLRAEKKMTLEELSLSIGLQPSAVSRYEDGTVSCLKPTVIEKMALALDSTPAYLMGWDNYAEQQQLPLKKSSLKKTERKLLKRFRQLSPKKQRAILALVKKP